MYPRELHNRCCNNVHAPSAITLLNDFHLSGILFDKIMWLVPKILLVELIWFYFVVLMCILERRINYGSKMKSDH